MLAGIQIRLGAVACPNFLNVRNAALVSIVSAISAFVYSKITTAPNQQDEFKIYNPILPKDPLECRVALSDYPASAGIHRIAEALGGREQYCLLPVLPWKERFQVDINSSIDGIKPSDLSAPIMRGTDPWSRHFITLRTNEQTRLTPGFIQQGVGVETLFQRYTNSLDIWTSGRLHSSASIVDSTVDNVAISRLKDLALGNPVTIPAGNNYYSVIKKLA